MALLATSICGAFFATYAAESRVSEPSAVVVTDSVGRSVDDERKAGANIVPVSAKLII